jgi:hypothetical protein
MLYAVSDPLAWTAAIAGVAATIGTWMGPLRARWKLRAEELLTSRARRENEVHRQRFADIWEWQRSRPEGPDRVEAARWFSEWTGAVLPRRGGLDSGPMPPGLHSGNVNEAYKRYVDFLDAVYQPGQPGPLQASGVRDINRQEPLELPDPDDPAGARH